VHSTSLSTEPEICLDDETSKEEIKIKNECVQESDFESEKKTKTEVEIPSIITLSDIKNSNDVNGSFVTPVVFEINSPSGVLDNGEFVPQEGSMENTNLNEDTSELDIKSL
jgi:hypothetical protein